MVKNPVKILNTNANSPIDVVPKTNQVIIFNTISEADDKSLKASAYNFLKNKNVVITY